MALQHTISFSNTTPVKGEIVTCVATVTNTGFTPEAFYINFSQQGMDPFGTSPEYLIPAGETKIFTSEFECVGIGTIGICADLISVPVLSVGVQQYPSDHYWHAPIDALPVHPMSNTYITTASADCTRGWCYVYFSTSNPLNYADTSTPTQHLTYIGHYETDGTFHKNLYSADDVPYPISESTQSHWSSNESELFILNWEDGKLYEMYNPVMEADETWHARAAIRFDLSTYALRPDWTTSVSGSGMPIFPSYARYEEVEAGEINHPLSVHMFTSQGTHVWAARAGGALDAGNMTRKEVICDDDPANPVARDETHYPPLGMRFRLKASFDISGFPYQEQVILRALKKYGIVLVDQNCSRNAWMIFGFKDPRWNVVKTDYHHFDVPSLGVSLKSTDFEAVDMTSLMIDWNSGQARV